jgi:hypothetical protein
MHGFRKPIRIVEVGLVLVALALLGAGPAGADPDPPPSARIASKLSSGPLTRYFVAHPESAPAASRHSLQQLRSLAARGEKRSQAPAKSSGPMKGDVFNKDTAGLPQNEESVTRCASRPDIVLAGTNDYRGLLDPLENFTGWHFSTDGGRSVEKEGLLPAIDFGGGKLVPSGGDPVEVSDAECNLYAGDLNYDPETFSPNGIGLYKSSPEQLTACSGGSDPACWPQRTVVAASTNPRVFLDKPWMHVGTSGGQQYVWVVYSEFVCRDEGCEGEYTSNSIMAVRCTTDLQCGQPQRISGDQQSIQFGDVTIGPDGRTYITWEQDNDLDADMPAGENMRFWLRVAPPGSTTFGPAHLVAVEQLNLGLAPLHANDFRVVTYPKNDVKMVRGKPRVFVVWEGCRARPLGDAVCEEPAVKMRYSTDLGASWSETKVLSAGGDNYFPTISANEGGSRLAVAWFTNRFDRVFHNRQDVELASVSVNGHVKKRARLTRVSNESEADPMLGGGFIGDYIEVTARDDRALVAYNANYRSMPILGEAFAVPQQDNYLTRHRL